MITTTGHFIVTRESNVVNKFKGVHGYTFLYIFFNLLSDQSIYANKVVLCARCSVMAVMFGGKFLESDQSTLAEVKYIVF